MPTPSISRFDYFHYASMPIARLLIFVFYPSLLLLSLAEPMIAITLIITPADDIVYCWLRDIT
jgi:hypothetical protein